jgi:hypothetical protein
MNRRVYFAINARSETVTELFKKNVPARAYLVPPNALSRALKPRLLELSAKRLPLVLDNGNYDDISRIINNFATKVSGAISELAETDSKSEHFPRWEELPPRMQSQRISLANELASAASKVVTSNQESLFSFAKGGLIGVENLTGALILRAGLDVPLMPSLRRDFRERNRQVARAATKIRDTLPTEIGDQYLPVASAVNYETAFDAGFEFAKAGLNGASMGFGAFMADNSFVEKIAVAGQQLRLQRRLPMRYLRTAAVARGFWDGWKSASGKAPERFHFLGLGAPIMIPIVYLAAFETKHLSFDATSPIRDAVEGTLYTSQPAYLKVRCRSIAWQLASGQLKSWNCPCKFCVTFTQNFPFNYPLGRRWGTLNSSKDNLSAAILQPGGVLCKAYPLLSEPKAGDLRRAVSLARSGHNHWALEQVFIHVRKNSSTVAEIRRHVKTIVSDYAKAASKSVFAEAVTLALGIATGAKI